MFKKSSLILIFLASLFTNVHAQNCCSCEAMIDWKFKGVVSIYDRPNGKVIDTFFNDSIKDMYWTFTIIDSNESFFKIALQENEESEMRTGWIKKEKYIGTYARNYQGNELFLYSKPDQKSAVESIVKKYIPYLYIIEDCAKDWVKVKIEYEGKTYSG